MDIKGKNYSKAIALYRIAEKKGNDVTTRVLSLENILNEQSRNSHQDYDDYGYDDYDYERETWDTMRDGFDRDYDF